MDLKFSHVDVLVNHLEDACAYYAQILNANISKTQIWQRGGLHVRYAVAMIGQERFMLVQPLEGNLKTLLDTVGLDTVVQIGEIMFDQANPAASSVSVSFPVKTMLTGWQERFDHFMTPDFFDAADDEMVTFTSTAIEVTGEKTAKITGDLTLNGVTKSVVLDAALTQAGEHPMAK